MIVQNANTLSASIVAVASSSMVLRRVAANPGSKFTTQIRKSAIKEIRYQFNFGKFTKLTRLIQPTSRAACQLMLGDAHGETASVVPILVHEYRDEIYTAPLFVHSDE